MEPDNHLVVKNVVKHYPIRKGLFSKIVGNVHAVDGVSFQIDRGKTFGLVGESGCGKSTLARLLMSLEPLSGGQILYKGQDISRFSKKHIFEIRRKMQLIFQDPYSSLNPRKSIGHSIEAPLVTHGIAANRKERRELVTQMMDEVGLDVEQFKRYPHEFSGGQRQRVCIARAMILEPEFVLCDEPVSALDVSIQAQVINLLCNLQKKRNVTYFFISHDLNVVKHISDVVAVMYLGRIVELAPKNVLYKRPLHPYSQALISSAPEVNLKQKKKRTVLTGDVPSPIDPPKGCHFCTRCRYVEKKCTNEPSPELIEVEHNHFVRCWLY